MVRQQTYHMKLVESHRGVWYHPSRGNNFFSLFLHLLPALWTSEGRELLLREIWWTTGFGLCWSCPRQPLTDLNLLTEKKNVFKLPRPTDMVLCHNHFSMTHHKKSHSTVITYLRVGLDVRNGSTSVHTVCSPYAHVVNKPNLLHVCRFTVR